MALFVFMLTYASIDQGTSTMLRYTNPILAEAYTDYMGMLRTANSTGLEDQLLSSSRTVYKILLAIFVVAFLQLYTTSLNVVVMTRNMPRLLLSRIIY